MEILTINLAAGEKKRFERAGSYVEIISSTAPVDLYFSGRNGNRTDSALGVLSGIYIETPFSTLEVASETAQSVILLVTDGRGGSRRQPGRVEIIDAIGSGCQTKVLTDPGAIGATIIQLVAPAANVNGILLRAWHMSATAGAGGNGTARVFASPGPVTNTDTGTGTGAQAALVVSIFGVANQTTSSSEFGAKRSIPPGWGLFLAINANVAAFPTGIVLSFELL